MSADDIERLEPCPKTPNCVSTQAVRSAQRMEPIPYASDLETARERLLAALKSEPRTRVDDVGERTVRAVFITRIMRFRDDAVFLFDTEAHLIHFRSASRIGRSDWGANRARMERVTARFLAVESAAELPDE